MKLLKIVFIIIFCFISYATFCQGEFVVEINPQNGTYKKTGPKIPNVTFIFPGERAFDPLISTYIFSSASSEQRIYSIDTKNGSVVSNPFTNEAFYFQFNNKTRKFYGAKRNNALNKKNIFEIDRVSGVSNVVSQDLIGSSAFQGQFSAINGEKNHYTIYDPSGSLVTINLTDGKILYSPKLKDGNKIFNLVYDQLNSKLYGMISQNGLMYYIEIDIVSGNYSIHHTVPLVSNGNGSTTIDSKNQLIYHLYDISQIFWISTYSIIEKKEINNVLITNIDNQDNLYGISIDDLTGKLYSLHWDRNITPVCTNDTIKSTLTKTICNGDSVRYNNKTYKSAGTYYLNNKTSAGCDSITSLVLSINDTLRSTIIKTICSGDSVKINNIMYKTSGNYIQELRSNSGCDSLLQINLKVEPHPLPPVSKINCDSSNYIFSMKPILGWDYIWQNFFTGNDFSFNGGVLILQGKSVSGCKYSYADTLLPLPRANNLPILTNKILSQKNSIEVTLPLDKSEWSVEWSPTLLVSCNDCFTTTINADVDTSISIRFIHQSGCEYTKTFKVLLNRSLHPIVPNIINLNRQNKITIALPENHTLVNMTIYNRWGNKIFTVLNNNIIDLPQAIGDQAIISGVYSYQIQLIDEKGQAYYKLGDITILR